MHSETTVPRIVAASASAASWRVPRWPTIAVSVSRYSGSAARAPRAGRLPDGTPLSACVADADTDAELQTAGLVLTTAADRLAERATRGDAVAALRLGYLTGAVRRGAAHTAGVGAELERRVSRAGAYVAEDGGAAAGAAPQRGLTAGQVSG